MYSFVHLEIFFENLVKYYIKIYTYLHWEFHSQYNHMIHDAVAAWFIRQKVDFPSLADIDY